MKSRLEWQGHKRRMTALKIPIPIVELICQIRPLTGEEFDGAQKKFKIVQSGQYTSKIKSLRKSEIMCRKSEIYNLNPIINEQDILRLAGRFCADPAILNESL